MVAVLAPGWSPRVDRDVTQGPRLILLCGLPGSGKTTLAQQLAVQVPAMRLGGDEWMAKLGLDLGDEAARERLEKLFWEIAQELLGLGISVILESGFWLRSDRDEKRLGARALGVPVELRYLDVPIDELVRRLQIRNAGHDPTAVTISRTQLEGWLPFFAPPDETELDLFDRPRSDQPSDDG